MSEVNTCKNCLHFTPKKRTTEGKCLRHTHISTNGIVERGNTDATSACWDHSESESHRAEYLREQRYEDMRGAFLEALIRFSQVKAPEPEPTLEPTVEPAPKTKAKVAARKKA